MAQHAITSLHQLDTGFVLAPERYDPRRHFIGNAGIPITEIAEIIAETLTSEKADKNSQYFVLDTSDASEGIVRSSKEHVASDRIGSAKKIARPGDVIISRLRPYLRQVAFIDNQLTLTERGSSVILCSTEFFVLRSRDGGSIAFLVPYLLSKKVQETLSVSQEGGHHPRFSQTTLQTVCIPDSILRRREELSSSVERFAMLARQADLGFKGLIAECSA